MLDRRKYIRVEDNAHITYQIIHTAKTGDYVTKDISQGGISFFVNEFIPKGAVLKVRLDLKGIPFSFEALVHIVWVVEDQHKEGYEVGAEFENLSEDDTRYLIDYISSILGRQNK